MMVTLWRAILSEFLACCPLREQEAYAILGSWLRLFASLHIPDLSSRVSRGDFGLCRERRLMAYRLAGSPFYAEKTGDSSRERMLCPSVMLLWLRVS